MDSTPIGTSTYMQKAAGRAWDGETILEQPSLLNEQTSKTKRAKSSPPVTQLIAHHSKLFAALGIKAEHDETLDCVDFMTTAKGANRCPVKILTVKPTTETKVEIVSATFHAVPVSADQINAFLAENTPCSDDAHGSDTDTFRTVDTASFEALLTKFFDATTAPTITAPHTPAPTHTHTQLSAMDTTAAPDSEAADEAPAPILVSIEGNIGAGKSTVLNVLKEKHPDWVFIDEPVDTWTALKNADGTNLLEHFYGDQVRWAYTFQNCALLSRFNNIENTILRTQEADKDKPFASKRRIYVTERCLDTDRRVFATMMYEDKKMNKIEMDLYNRWYDMLHTAQSGGATPLSAIVYINTSPELCASRIVQRSRGGEQGIPLEYLKSLDSYQRRWCEASTLPTLPCDSNRNPEEVGVDISDFVTGLYEL